MRFGVLGWGSIGSRHGANLVNLGGHDVYYWDPVPAVNQPHWTRERIIAESDAIIVCSPSKEHAKDFMDVTVSLGGPCGKHVLVEKPFGYDSPDFLKGYLKGIRDKRPKLIVATGYMCRFHPCVQRAKFYINSGTMGEIQAASFSVLQKSEKEVYLRDGIIRNWLSHEIDLANHLLGPGATTISCTADDQREAFLVMNYPSVKDKVFLQADYFTTPQQRFFWVEGSKKSLYVNLEVGEMYTREKDGPPGLLYQCPHGPQSIWDQTYIDEMKAFIHSIETGVHQAPLATGEDGIEALYTIMAARKAAGLENI